MKTNRMLGVLLMVTGLTVASCAGSQQMKMVNNGDIPAAESTVKLSRTDNGNTGFELVVKHLATPSRVDPSATVYVVWIRGSDAASRVQNMGALKVDDDLDGSFDGVTPLREFELFVTAEPSAVAPTPTGKALLYTTVAAK